MMTFGFRAMLKTGFSVEVKTGVKPKVRVGIRSDTSVQFTTEFSAIVNLRVRNEFGFRFRPQVRFLAACHGAYGRRRRAQRFSGREPPAKRYCETPEPE